MERAVFVQSADELADVHPDFSRIYFGEEHCGRRIPSASAVLAVAQRCLDAGRQLTVATPVATDTELEQVSRALTPCLELATRHGELGLEVVVNDWGVLSLLQDATDVPLSLGVHLARQKRDPSFCRLFSGHGHVQLTETDRRHMTGSSIDSTPAMLRFVERHFRRAEIANTVQGFFTRSRLPLSLHLPLVPVTTTRYCKVAAMEAGAQNASDYFACHRPCEGRVDIYQSPYHSLYLWGNTQFYLNWELPRQTKGVDRVVHNLRRGFPMTPTTPLGWTGGAQR